jgi:hypothetical protein
MPSSALKLHNVNEINRPRQYKRVFKRWGLQKNVPEKDMVHLVRIQRRRLGVAGKQTQFSVRNRLVSSYKIDRFKKSNPCADASAGKYLKSSYALLSSQLCLYLYLLGQPGLGTGLWSVCLGTVNVIIYKDIVSSKTNLI